MSPHAKPLAQAPGLPEARQYAAGLWLTQAALQPAAHHAAACCPEAVLLADNPGWVAGRRLEFLAGRGVAAQSLRALQKSTVLPRGADGLPQWPAGCVGSIAHNAQWAVAAAGDALQWAAVGVDVEQDAPLPEDAAHLVLRPEDHTALRQAFANRAAAAARLVFSAKECVHKALHPWRGVWLEFDEVATQWSAASADHGRWQALPVSAAATQAFTGETLHGEWWRQDGALWCLLAIARRG